MKKRIANIYYILLLLASAGFVLYRALSFGSGNFYEEEKVEEGVLDLTAVDLDNRIIPLQGDFEFYWLQLLDPSSFDDTIQPVRSGYIELPGLWNKYQLEGEEIGGRGYATFRFKILVPEEGTFGIKIKEFDTAYRIWMNDRYLETGIVSTSTSQLTASWKRAELVADSRDRLLDVVLQVANYSHRKGGPEDLMLFGKAEEIAKVKRNNLNTENFLVGFIFLTFLYHLGLFFFRMSDPSTLYFAFINLIIGARLFLTGEKQLLDIFPGLEWLLAVRIEYLTIFLPALLFILFFHSIYPGYAKRIISQIAIIVTAIFVLALFVLPSYIFTWLSLIAQPFIILAIIYVIYFLARIVSRREKYALFLLIGAVVFALITINELLFYNKLIQTGYLLPLGLLVVIFTISYGLSGRFSYALDESVRLQNLLKDYNIRLEEKILSRTEVTENQKKLLEVQTTELRHAIRRQQVLSEFRDTMTHLLVHDMKNLLSAIVNLDEESPPDQVLLARQSGYQLQNMIQNLMEIQQFKETGIVAKIKKADLHETVSKVIGHSEYNARIKHVKLVNLIPIGTSARYDTYLIERVLTNLVINAIKFSPKNSRIEIRHRTEPKHMVVSVVDNGVGIDPEFHERIFEKYGQVESEKEGKSTGLGLAFCRLALEAHNRNIGVNSEPGKGSEFWFTLHR